MAKITLSLRVRVAWWVRPYMALALTFAWTMRPFLTDEDIEALGNAVAETVTSKGVRLVID